MVSPVLIAPYDKESRDADNAGVFAAEVTQYDAWGWTTTSAGDRLLLVTDSGISAVETSRALGGEVLHYLAVHELDGAVVQLPSTPCRWVFLTSSAHDAAPIDLARVCARGAVVHHNGALVPLPPSRLHSGEVDWHCPPRAKGLRLTPFTALAGALRAVTHSAGCS